MFCQFPYIYRNPTHDVYVTPRACSWGWGTWKKRWKKVDWVVTDYQGLKVSMRRRKEFNRGGLDTDIPHPWATKCNIYVGHRSPRGVVLGASSLDIHIQSKPN